MTLQVSAKSSERKPRDNFYLNLKTTTTLSQVWKALQRTKARIPPNTQGKITEF